MFNKPTSKAGAKNKFLFNKWPTLEWNTFHIRLGWIGLPRTDALAYFEPS